MLSGGLISGAIVPDRVAKRLAPDISPPDKSLLTDMKQYRAMIAYSADIFWAGIGSERFLTRMFRISYHQKRHLNYLHLRILVNIRTHEKHIYKIPFAFIPDGSQAFFM